VSRINSKIPGTAKSMVNHHEDFCAWAEQQAQLLWLGKYEEADIINVAGELKKASADRRGILKKNIRRIIESLIMIQVDPDLFDDLELDIIDFREGADAILKESPSLCRELEQIIDTQMQFGKLSVVHELLAKGVKCDAIDDVLLSPSQILGPWMPEREEIGAEDTKH